MREELLGYLLDALEPAERESLEQRLAESQELQLELGVVHQQLAVLRHDKERFEVPSGLAERTCAAVFRQAELSPTVVAAAPAEVRRVSLAPQLGGGPARWRMSDLVVAAGVFLAAAMLLFPALNQSIAAARLNGCKNNLQQIGTGLVRYSNAHGGQFPDISTEGNFASAGVYAVRLMEGRYVDSPAVFVCPASPLAAQKQPFNVPSIGELRRVRGPQLVVLRRRMGGAYGYNLGYLVDGKYSSPRNLQRPNFALVSDAPAANAMRMQSDNHGGGQNVLFEDGHVAYMTECSVGDCGDNIFLNDQGLVAAGLGPHDAVIGGSAAQPFFMPVSRPVN